MAILSSGKSSKGSGFGVGFPSDIDKKFLKPVRVIDIILDISHEKAEEYGGYDAIGTIFFTKLDDNIPLEKNWTNINNTARPVFSISSATSIN